MCIMFVQRPYVPRVAKKTFYRCYERNPHGGGLAIAHQNKLTVIKGFFNPDLFWEAYNNIPRKATVIAHFRASSTEHVNLENCHPFMIDDEHCVVHNGAIFDFFSTDEENKWSDTALYTHIILKPLFKKDKNLWRTKLGHYLLSKSLGWNRNVLVILDNRGKYVIYNEGYGLWSKGIYFSNDSHKEFSEYSGTTLPAQLSFPFLQLREPIAEEVAEVLTQIQPKVITPITI